MVDNAKLHSPVCSTFQALVLQCGVRSGVVVKKNLALSVGQCWMQALQFLVHLINLLKILLRCNDLSRFRK